MLKSIMAFLILRTPSLVPIQNPRLRAMHMANQLEMRVIMMIVMLTNGGLIR